MRNPFTPTFGVTPPVLVGRERDIDHFSQALDAGPGDPFRAMKVHGLRGSGKTVFLNAIEDAARQRGWYVISETARPGLARRLETIELPRFLANNDPRAVTSEFVSAGASAAGVSATATRDVEHRYNPRDDLRSLLARAADLKDRGDAGVLITIDEVGPQIEDDFRELTQSVQHAFREGRQVAFVCAGLYIEVQDLITKPGMTFLRRAEEAVLGRVSDSEVRRGLLDPLQTWGRRILSEALDVAVDGVQGYPYMIQLIGHRMWALSEEETPIDRGTAREAHEYALRRVGQLVLNPELRPLSSVDKSYLVAMAQDQGASLSSAIAQRLGVSSSYGAVYRDRLLKAGLILSDGRGRVRFALPALRDYLLDHAASGIYEASPAGEPDPHQGAQAHLDLDLPGSGPAEDR